MYEDLYIRTQYDGRDYRSVVAIYQFDSTGDEQELVDLTKLCMDITTCADQGYDTWSWIKEQVSIRLKSANVTYTHLLFDEDEPSLES